MIKLISSEFRKIFHKKSFFIVTLIFIFYSILTNFIYKNLNDYAYLEESINVSEYKKINEELDLTNNNDLNEYVSNLTIIETYELKENYEGDTKEYLIDTFLSELINESYQNKYIDKNDEEYNLKRNQVNDYIEHIKNNDWQYFVNLKILELNNSLDKIKDEKTKDRLNEVIKLEEYRLKNNVDFENDNYLNRAIIELETDIYEYYNLKDKENLTNDEKERLLYLEESYLKNNYILEEKVDINNSESLQAVLQNFPAEFGLFILIYVIMISGSIVSEEFNKGTIKYLLTKPFKRRTILTSKLLTVLILIPIIILFMMILEVIIGGLILGFDSLKVPVLIFNNSTYNLVSYNIFIYIFKLLLSEIPMYIVLSVFCFMLSTITTSTSAAITITFLFYLVSEVIANIVLMYDISILKSFISVHWDFSYLVNLVSNPFGFSISHSLFVILLYLITMLCITYVYFNKKDVKNI